MKLHARVGLALSAVALAALTACGSTTAPGGSATSAPASSSSSTPSTSASGTLHTASTALGTILVNGAGMTVYFYDHDKAGETSSACTGPCASLWPAVSTTSATPTIMGVTGKVATITGVDGAKQVTLNGLPLYTFTADKKAGDTTGQGYGGIWWVIGTNGAKITAASSSAPAQGGNGY
jgi:predicted lipoprotein with Yx(FWY)xxD motif